MPEHWSVKPAALSVLAKPACARQHGNNAIQHHTRAFLAFPGSGNALVKSKAWRERESYTPPVNFEERLVIATHDMDWEPVSASGHERKRLDEHTCLLRVASGGELSLDDSRGVEAVLQ